MGVGPVNSAGLPHSGDSFVYHSERKVSPLSFGVAWKVQKKAIPKRRWLVII